jgi:hypothetical protein
MGDDSKPPGKIVVNYNEAVGAVTSMLTYPHFVARMRRVLLKNKNKRDEIVKRMVNDLGGKSWEV